jgi:hypothetical protein
MHRPLVPVSAHTWGDATLASRLVKTHPQPLPKGGEKKREEQVGGHPQTPSRGVPLHLLYSKSELLLVSLLSALLVAVAFFTTNRISTSSIWYPLDGYDHHRYIAMATGNPLDFHLAPFCWRILDPLIVKLQPFGFEAGFLLVTLISLWLCGIVVYYLTKVAGFAPVYGLFSLLLFFSLGWAVKQNVFDFWLPDALGYLFILVAIYAILKKRDLLFVILLAVGVLAKESVFFVAPLYYTLNAAKLIDVKLLRRTVLFAIPALLALLLVRLGIPQLNGDPAYIVEVGQKFRLVTEYESAPYSLTDLFQTIGMDRLHALTPYNVGLRYLVFPLGITLLGLPLFAIKQNAKLLLRFAPFLALVYIQLLFAVNTERLVVLAFPPLLLMSTTGIRNLMSRLDLNPVYALCLPAALFVLSTLSLDYEWFYQSTYVQIVLCLLFLAAIGILAIGKYKQNRPGKQTQRPA